MDSKITAAIIIAVALLGSTWLYTKDNAYTRCMTAREEYWGQPDNATEYSKKSLALRDCANVDILKSYSR